MHALTVLGKEDKSKTRNVFFLVYSVIKMMNVLFFSTWFSGIVMKREYVFPYVYCIASIFLVKDSTYYFTKHCSKK